MADDQKNEGMQVQGITTMQDLERQFKEVKEIEEYEREIRDLEHELQATQEERPDPYLDPALENEFQEIRRTLVDKEKQYQKIDIQTAFHSQQLQQKAKDLMTNVKNDNAVLGDYVQSEYQQLIEQETKTVAEKVRKLRQTLNSLNDEIKNFEKEHQAQVDHLSSQKRWVNEERKKKDKLKDEIAMYREK